MTPITQSIIINCSQQDLFDFVTDFRNDTKWWKPVIRTEKTTNGDINIGTQFIQYAKVMFITVENNLKVTEWQPPEYVTYSNESPQLSYSLRYEFQPTEQGTQFTLFAELEMKGLLLILKPITMWKLQGQLEKYFGLLKKIMEHSN